MKRYDKIKLLPAQQSLININQAVMSKLTQKYIYIKKKPAYDKADKEEYLSDQTLVITIV